MPQSLVLVECPACGHPYSKVVSTTREHSDNTTLRRRHCKSCDHRWYTLQQPEEILNAYQVSWRNKDSRRTFIIANQ